MTVTPTTDRDELALLNPGRLWAGGIATAVVAALIMVVGVYIARGILGIPVLVRPYREGPTKPGPQTNTRARNLEKVQRLI